ncbi:peptidase M28-like protein [Chitinophaga skermanii]|uniref:Peptidase M28-like protein n=1 Tax=Chitinophaga skermanii TaxID=331697 RepID=A0A327QBX5_9BACT|nr:M28 family peptidase [Chitinophaga skermanii]RAJ01475.1 peptidase M28-like protein [Chitinophaga skermanii]
MKNFCIALLCFASLQAAAQKTAIDSAQLMKDVATLADDKYEGRLAGTKGNRLAQFYILDRFKQIGITPYNNTYEQPFYFEGRNNTKTMGTNLYGYLKGTSNDSVIIITAHYDHVGTRSRSGQTDSIFNGADDNASGVGALLAMATYFKAHPPKNTIIFVALDAEELGLKGAHAFANALPVEQSKVMVNINMDMVSHNDKNELYVCGTYHYPHLKKYIEEVAAKSHVKLIPGHDLPNSGHDDWTGQSDHYEFHALKIPFLYFGVEDHPDYHKASDEYDKINHSFYYHAVQDILEVVKRMDSAALRKDAKSKTVYAK